MENDKMVVPYIVYESAEAKHERTVKRLVIALVIAVLAIFLSNALWLNAWMQYDYSDSTVTVDAGDSNGNANYIGPDGDIINGESNSTETNEDEKNGQ